MASASKILRPPQWLLARLIFSWLREGPKADLLEAAPHFGTKISMEPAEPAAFGFFGGSILLCWMLSLGDYRVGGNLSEIEILRQSRNSNLPIRPHPDSSGFLLRTWSSKWTSKANSIGRQPISTNGGRTAKSLSLVRENRRIPTALQQLHENPTYLRRACTMPT